MGTGGLLVSTPGNRRRCRREWRSPGRATAQDSVRTLAGPSDMTSMHTFVANSGRSNPAGVVPGAWSRTLVRG